MSRKRFYQRASRHGYFTEGLMRKEKDLENAHHLEMEEDILTTTE